METDSIWYVWLYAFLVALILWGAILIQIQNMIHNWGNKKLIKRKVIEIGFTLVMTAVLLVTSKDLVTVSKEDQHVSNTNIEITNNRILPFDNDVTELENKLSDLQNRLDVTEQELNKHVIKLNNGSGYIMTEDDYEVLIRITEAEATSGTIEQKRNVAWAVINRLKSKRFPSNSIYDVVFQKVNGKTQFSPTSDGRYYKVKVTESTKQAVTDVTEGIGEHYGVFFFNRASADKGNIGWFDTLTPLFNDGVHEYFTY